MSSTATVERGETPKPSTATTAESAASSVPETEAAGCPKCGTLESWGTASWCPNCGYYPRLGMVVGGEQVAAQEPDSQPAPSTHLEALARLPQWSYILAAGVIGIFFVSLAVRIVTPDDSLARSLWSTTQLLVGALTFIGMHAYAFIKAGARANRLNAFDIIVHPIDVWRPTFQGLPGTAKRVWAGIWGLTAAICAITIIGGIRYSVLTEDWGFKERPKQNLMKRIRDQMLANAKDAEEGADNLNDAIKDFAGDEEAKKKEEEKKHELEMLSADCVVIGYNVDKQTGDVTGLVLATVVDDKLQYAGVVNTGISEEAQEQLRKKLPALEQKDPFLKCPVSAIWVKPVVTCRTSFKSWSENKRMESPVFEELLAETDLK